MTVTWRSAVSYALTVTVLSFLTGAAVDLAWQAPFGDFGLWVSVWAGNPWSAVFVGAAATVLTLTRRLTGPLPVWRVPLIDGSAYLVVLLVCAGLESWAYGDEAPADSAFAMASFALLTLQLPSAWLLIVWRARHLDTVLTRAALRAARADGR
ncbi:hypothetical protein ACFOOM_22350 [Streptomyces echinoruber]|uniref:Uncharacterized protein n=1 Tax=Streptomyces echinoruber TaxID=68898 RepID=A0A918VAS8_9ACTN|nr:hypothetical protein [Streptomyces echinoruber]GGZ82170.1 hypothetical protein GCM10010389_20130 [Streptomyces echinoruber]